MHSIPRSLAVFILAACLGPQASAQCPFVWSSGGPQRELTGDGYASTLWDPDGAGPAPEVLVVGGKSLIGGSQPIDQRVMTWDGSQWQALGPGPGTAGTVTFLTVWNGQLVAAGNFTGGGMDHIALWNGSAWQPLGPGFPTVVTALTVWNGNVVAAGFLSNLPTIRTWNGVSWTPLPTPPLLQAVHDMVPFQGQLCVGGAGAIGTGTGVVERWNGASWLQSTTATGGPIFCMAVRTFGLGSTLFVGGSFATIGGLGTSCIASTSGGASFAWSPVGNGLPAACLDLHVPDPALGAPIVARINSSSTAVMQLSGGAFLPMSNLPISSISYYAGAYHATRNFGDVYACYRYDGAAFVPVRGPGVDGEVYAAARFGDDVVIGGWFESISGVPMNRIARWDGSTFHPLGSGMSMTFPVSARVDALLTLDNGDLVAGGQFADAGGVSASNIARWNGSGWSALGSGLSGRVYALCKLPNGDLVAGGSFGFAGSVPCSCIARWDGTSWSPFGAGVGGPVYALAVRGDGTLFAGGSFTSSGGIPCSRIAQWDGSMWMPVANGCNGDVYALAALPNGSIVAAGSFSLAGSTPVSSIARWTGAVWAPMPGAGTGAVRALALLPNGDLVAGRAFHTASAISGISRWNGSGWSGLGGVLDLSNFADPVVVRALAQRADGELIVGGAFSLVDGVVSRNLTSVRSTCMPTASPYGAGCSSAAGALVITAATLPWLGATFRTATTGIAPASLCLALTGFTQVSIPLSSLLAEGQPGCTLLASPDVLALLLPDGTGTAHSALVLPPSPSLIGASFFQQTVPFEYDGLGAPVAVRGSNGLVLTIGTL